jgi:3'-phosphoadenosine 5'-phosphosulfate sulfotransferase (PAPS reductase)/FAD synthetase
MQYIASFSTGLSSALVVELAAARGLPLRAVFCDTLIEHPDNYRFLADCAARWRELYGLEIETLTAGRDPYQVFADNHIIPNSLVAPCTQRLKTLPFESWLKTNAQLGDTVLIGYDWKELHRIPATQARYEKIGYAVDFPLANWQHDYSGNYADIVRARWGIEPPAMYGLGYTHANCGGACVKQGQGDWLRTLRYQPDVYARIEAWEEQMRQNPTNANYAILKDRTGGDTKPLTLRQLRERQGGQLDFLLLTTVDELSACVRCGVGDI